LLTDTQTNNVDYVAFLAEVVIAYKGVYSWTWADGLSWVILNRLQKNPTLMRRLGSTVKILNKYATMRSFKKRGSYETWSRVLFEFRVGSVGSCMLWVGLGRVKKNWAQIQV